MKLSDAYEQPMENPELELTCTVYNINKGFADFKEITILYSNDEYSIVKSNTNYGLLEYDYIVLDAESINEDDFINE